MLVAHAPGIGQHLYVVVAAAASPPSAQCPPSFAAEHAPPGVVVAAQISVAPQAPHAETDTPAPASNAASAAPASAGTHVLARPFPALTEYRSWGVGHVLSA
jgi:hypothetical protein